MILDVRPYDAVNVAGEFRLPAAISYSFLGDTDPDDGQLTLFPDDPMSRTADRIGDVCVVDGRHRPYS